MTHRSPFPFRVDHGRAVADDDVALTLFADGGPVCRAVRAAALLRPEIEARVGRGASPACNALDVLWFAVGSAPTQAGEALALLGVSRDDALAVVAEGCLLGVGDVPESLRAEALARWGDCREREARCDDVVGRLLGVRLLDDGERRRLLRNARASRARHLKRAASGA